MAEERSGKARSQRLEAIPGGAVKMAISGLKRGVRRGASMVNGGGRSPEERGKSKVVHACSAQRDAWDERYGEFWTTSLVVSRVLEKEHRNVLTAIAGFECSQTFEGVNLNAHSYQSESTHSSCGVYVFGVLSATMFVKKAGKRSLAVIVSLPVSVDAGFSEFCPWFDRVFSVKQNRT